MKDDGKGNDTSLASSQAGEDINEKPEAVSDTSEYGHIHGWRLSFLSLGIALCFFLVFMEVPIIATSLVSITDDLHGFDQAGWVVTGYLLTYAGLLIIWSKLGDIYGRKPTIITAMFIFLVFSGGCGAAQTIVQLIVCRVMQGIGAAGSISLSYVIGYEMIPKHKYPAQIAQVSLAISLGSLVGPLIGGAVSQRSTWRWVFLLNVPGGFVTMILLFLCIPKDFPHQGDPSYQGPTLRERFSASSLMRLDVTGAFFLLGATTTLVAVLLEAGNQFSWSSGTAIALLVVSGILWIAFMLNEKIMTNDKRPQEPIFPWRFIFNREWMGTLLISLLSGIPYNIIVIDLPERFQTIDGYSPLQAGVRLLPFNFLIAFGSVFVNVIAVKTRIPPIFLIIAGSIIELIGLALLTTLPEDGTFTHAIYGYQVLTGLGIGFVMGITSVLPPHLVEARDLAISGGAYMQSRVLGGVIGLAIGSSVLNNHLTSQLVGLIGPAQLAMLQQSTAVIQGFPPSVQNKVITVFAQGYNLQFKILTAFAGAQLLVTGVLWRKKQISVVEEKQT